MQFASGTITQNGLQRIPELCKHIFHIHRVCLQVLVDRWDFHVDDPVLVAESNTSKDIVEPKFLCCESKLEKPLARTHVGLRGARHVLHLQQSLCRAQVVSHYDLIMVYTIFHRLVNINANELIHIKTSSSTISTRGHRFKLQTSQFELDVVKNHFCNRVVCNWNKFLILLLPLTPLITFKKAFHTVNFESALTLIIGMA